MKENFYDIESLSNVFTLCNFRPDTNTIDVFVLSDDDHLLNDHQFYNKMVERIYAKNSNFNGKVIFYNLKEDTSNIIMAKIFGLSNSSMVNNPNITGEYDISLRPVCDTDPDYNEDGHPYLWGYNSYNYDTTMLAVYFDTVFHRQYLPSTPETPDPAPIITIRQANAQELRNFNDILFTDMFKSQMPQALTRTAIPGGGWSDPDYQDNRWKIRKAMLMSGRHLDVGRLNEKQSKVGLKRLLGMRGYQILESDKLGANVSTIKTMDELLDLIAYNVSDVVNLYHLRHEPYYEGQFALKQGLLKSYPELIYNKQKDAYKPEISPTTVRRERLTIDSSSAQFATKALCPYDHLTDIPVVSFNYPSDRKIAELKAEGIDVKQVNVLEESKKFFYENFSQPHIRVAFDKIYQYYKSIEGKNFNDSDNYKQDFGINGQLPTELEPVLLKEIPKAENNIVYYNKDGSPSSCFVTFSTGGIHGAEYNKALYEYHLAIWEQERQDMDYVQSIYPDPLDLRNAKVINMPDGTEYKYNTFIRSSATIKAMNATDPAERAKKFYKNPAENVPVLFKPSSDGSTKINGTYVYTSADLTTHEDFTSYYPNMLRMMSAFWNDGLGFDRYGEIFNDKERYGKLMKDKTLPKEERELYAILREGTKLILNSASGAGDTNFKSPIQMNNRIIAMRIIGQLFTWRIGQAQTIYGARITSTNTDGLFSVLESELNNMVLAKESESIGVEIEPEPTYLISKDSNNRLEMDPDTGKIQAASGSSLSCYKDTNATKSLAHPAIIDWALCEYLVVTALNYKGLAMHKEFNDDIGMNILKSAINKFEPDHLLRMFQNVIASSVGSMNYVFGTSDDDPSKPIWLQHYNRVFITKDKTPGAIHLHAANAKQLTPAMIAKRQRDNERMVQHDMTALNVLSLNGVRPGDIPSRKEAVVKKVTSIDAEWYMLVDNNSLYDMSDARRQEILDALDYDKYLILLRDAYEKNWRNKMPPNWPDKDENLSEPQSNDTDETPDLSTQSIDNDTGTVIELDVTNGLEKNTCHLFITNDNGDLLLDVDITTKHVDTIMTMIKQSKGENYE